MYLYIACIMISLKRHILMINFIYIYIDVIRCVFIFLQIDFIHTYLCISWKYCVCFMHISPIHRFVYIDIKFYIKVYIPPSTLTNNLSKKLHQILCVCLLLMMLYIISSSLLAIYFFFPKNI